MAKTHSAMEPRASAWRTLTTKPRQRGTTLVEILVVIVIFLIGILAVVQIFPRGFRLLLTTRNNSVATALGRDAIERLKDSPDLLPEEIVPVRYSGITAVVDSSLDPLALGPLGDGVGPTGILTNGGTTVTKDWMLSAGPNRARRIIGEGHRLPAPRAVGSLGTGTQRYENYGGLLVLDHGPVAEKSVLVAYANDLSRTIGAPRDTQVDTVSGDAVALGMLDNTGSPVTFAGQPAATPVSLAPYEFFVVNADTRYAAILVPANHRVGRTYRVRMSAYVGTPAAVKRYDYLSLSVSVPAVADTRVSMVQVPLAPLLNYTNEVMSGGGSLYAVESESIRVAPQYRVVSSWTAASDATPVDPFEMKVVDGNLGVLLFSPAGREGVVDRPGGVSEPLTARVDYDVRDWRIIGEEFRVVDGARSYTYPLSLQSLKVGSNSGPDGRANGGMFGAGTAAAPGGDSYDPSATPRDNVVIQDLTTGFEVQRYVTANTHNDGPNATARADADANGTDAASILVSVDKSRGSITLNDADPSTTALDVKLILPSGGTTITVPALNRTFRVLYRARQEWAVQIFKGASQYTLVSSLASPLAPDQAILGDNVGGTPWRIYFPNSEAGHKVTIDRIAYYDKNGAPQVLEGQDFLVHAAKPSESPSLAYADLRDVVATGSDPTLPKFSQVYGSPVQGVKGASVSVRVLWNPEAFTLGANAGDNIGRVDQWGRGWRKSTTDTYLRAEETR